MRIKRKQKRTHIIGALIFLALVAIVGFGLVATGNFHNPFNFFGGEQHQGGQLQVSSGTRASANFHSDRGSGQAPDRSGSPEGGSASDHSDHPDGDNNGGIAWNQIGAVFSDLWILSAIGACYILIQQTLELIANRFWTRKDPQPAT